MVGDYDQFTEVAVFPTQVMDSQLPPGMSRNKMSGLDKSLMGLEMRGGGGSSHTTTENPYDDAWIHDKFSTGEQFNLDRISEIGDLQDWNQDRISEIGDLQDWNQDRITEIQGINTRTDANTSNLDALKTRIDNWNTTTDVGDVVGLDDTLNNLLADYTKTADLPADQDLSDYMKTTDYNTRMNQNLTSLGDTLRGEWGRDIQTLDLDSVRDSISDVGGDLTQLTNRFAGINTDVDYLNSLDLGGLENRLDLGGLENRITSNRQGDLTNLRDIIESGRGEDLRNLQDTMGRDRAADLLDLRQKIDADRLTETEALAGNLRHEFGDQVFDLSDTFDRRLGDLQTSLGGDISDLFRRSGDLDSGVAALTSGLGTTSQQLTALRDSFGDYKTDAATNLANVSSAFDDKVGDLGTDFTARLGDLGSSTARDILGAKTSVAADVASARSEAATGIAGAREASVAGDVSLRNELTDARQKAISDLDTSWSGKLSDTESRFTREQDRNKADFDKRLSDISASLNYKTLDDSAQGVKIRRSRAYNTGRTRTGTRQLGRSMKIGTLNI